MSEYRGRLNSAVVITSSTGRERVIPWRTLRDRLPCILHHASFYFAEWYTLEPVHAYSDMEILAESRKGGYSYENYKRAFYDEKERKNKEPGKQFAAGKARINVRI